ncbi:hypothetical protein [Hyalangium versicolor]|uniref:hypothetical protein n=1 Tax=Hyalangium versicolor TaxID=2861190 RepID=UPI001CCB7838|nr:hypothetical protein [Hyalangium versicolor]
MKKKLLSAVVVCALGFIGCGGDDDDTNKPPAVPKFDTVDNIQNYLEGKKLVMEGDNIPAFPNGFSEDLDLGANSQCYHDTVITVSSRNFKVVSTAGTLRNVDPQTKIGDCDRTVANGSPQTFDSKAVLIENVKADASCFDISIDYGFKQEGRGSISADGKTITLELYFENQALGADCASGAVGAQTVTLNSKPFTGNAKQVYTISAQ